MFDIDIREENGATVAEVSGDGVIGNAQDFLNLFANCDAFDFVLHKQNVVESFFDLSTGLAGEVLQKVSNYGLRLAIVGDFSGYPSESLQAFIRESNRNGRVLFVASVDEAIGRFTGRKG